MSSVPVAVSASLSARWISSGPPAASPTARTEAWAITTSPGATPRLRRSAVSCARSNMAASDDAPAAGPAAARNAGDPLRVVVVGQLFTLADRAGGADPDVAALDVDVAIRPARVIDVARDV